MAIDKSILKKAFTLVLVSVLSFTLIFPSSLSAQTQSMGEANNNDNVFLYVGDLITVKVKSLTRVAVAKPGIVDVTNITTDEITLVGRKVGETQIFLWEEGNKRLMMARVLSTDLDLIASRIASLLSSVGLKGVEVAKNYYEGKLILTGSLNKNEKKKFEEIIKEFSGSIINLVVEEGDLIQIDVQFTELSTTLTKILGFDWTSTSGSMAFNIQESLPAQDGSFADLFKIGDFTRTSAIISVINLLISEGRARILSKPSLVVTNGEQASFLVGGEIPIRTTTTSVGGGSTQENITFKSYGVELTVKPEIRDGKIDIDVTVVVRDVDSSLVVSSGVAFLTRNAKTKVRISDEQTIVLAGMIQRRNSEDTRRVPYLSKIPVLGSLFKSTSTPNNEKELVVSLTPRILKKLAPLSNQQIKNLEAKADKNTESTTPPVVETKEIKTESEKAQPAMPMISAEQKDLPKAEVTQVPQVQKNTKKTGSLTPAEKKAADKKAKAKAKADEIRMKKEKAEKIIKEKEEKAREAREQRKARVTRAKGKSKKPQAAFIKKEKEVIKEIPVKAAKEQFNIENKKTPEDPSLNLSLDNLLMEEPKNTMTEEDIVALKEKYKAKVQKEMTESISYPYQAKESQWEGTAILNITILPDGNVKDVAITQSSGYSVFDKDAVNTAEILSPFDAFVPAKNLRELSISVPVDYSEKAILGTSVLDKN